MKFITEIDLRDLYRKEPFTTYELEPGVRLTPGARQFLMDMGIKMSEESSSKKVDIKKVADENVPSEKTSIEKNKSLKDKKLYNRMKSIEALFLLTGEELLRRDVFLSQSVINLARYFTEIKKGFKDGRISVENLNCSECTGINKNNFCDDLEDCFEITEFHMQLERGREIIILHNLRCALKEFQVFLLELCEEINGKNQIYDEIIKKVNQIINTLSQLICSIFGGTKCQRKS
ncbi:hypothetical protein SAMN05443428_101124 [Caloramator quimbayensis]|uniref:Ethanolamine utilization cobalamin adenosyltransferase n=1 Tax=Caloramator quimbayensis TaxID=1147123 RepID=A0A1T4WFR8_9CLOT|nr:hypothetical protein [Caloramator quimbayensis]SKA75999.1 hypothetical protein SAMN05443428_101124 [Caloramator quimbayensis]